MNSGVISLVQLFVTRTLPSTEHECKLVICHHNKNQADPLNNEGAILQLKAIWQTQHDRKVAQWNQERAEDQAVEDDCLRQEAEEEERNKAEREKEEDEHRKELD